MLGNAAGCHSQTIEELENLYHTRDCANITTKTMTLYPYSGDNEEPGYKMIRECESMNWVGLKNLGWDKYYQFAIAHRDKPITLSLSIKNIDETIKMLDMTDGSIPIELNISCPNTKGYGNLEVIEKIYEKWDFVNEFGLKMPPLIHSSQFMEWADKINILSPKLKFLTCCNTIPIMNQGALGGSPCRVIAQNNIKFWRDEMPRNIDIIGCGGIFSWQDANEYLKCGASRVQIGTALQRDGVSIFSKITSEQKNK